jgi:ubiquinone/menaquinone biosynthesis C-methylase UbiE
MNIADMINRLSPPKPWEEGDNIPWNEPGFSWRMLKEHLSQDHDAASRRFSIVDRQVDWIHACLLGHQPTTILDLACGPGLYSSRLARMGHTCYGIDYSPASIEYAISTAKQAGLSCTYTCQDIRQAIFLGAIGFVMLIYGEFNVFKPTDAAHILDKACRTLLPGGLLLLEPHPFQVVKSLGETPVSWYSSPGGLFSDKPHLLLRENFWDATTCTYTCRYFVIDARSSQVTRYAQSMQAYRDEEYLNLLSSHGFGEIQIWPGLLGDESPPGLIAITARKI